MEMIYPIGIIIYILLMPITYFINQHDIEKLEQKIKEQQKEIENLKKILKQNSRGIKP